MQVEFDFDEVNYNPNVRGIFGTNVQHPGNYNNSGNNPSNNSDQRKDIPDIKGAKTYLTKNLQCNRNTFDTVINLGLKLVIALEEKERYIDMCEQELRGKDDTIEKMKNEHIQERTRLQIQLDEANKIIQQREIEYAQRLANTNISDMDARISSLQEEKKKLEDQNKLLTSTLGEKGEDIMLTIGKLRDENEKLKKQIELSGVAVSQADLQNTLKVFGNELATIINTPVVQDQTYIATQNEAMRLAYVSNERKRYIIDLQNYLNTLQDWIENKMVVKYYNALGDASQRGDNLLNLIYEMLLYIDQLYCIAPPEYVGYERKNLNEAKAYADSNRISNISYEHYPRFESLIQFDAIDDYLENKYLDLLQKRPYNEADLISALLSKSTVFPRYPPPINNGSNALPAAPQKLFNISPDQQQDPRTYYSDTPVIENRLPQPHL